MAESGLSVTYSTLRSELGYTIGYGRTSSNWTADQASEIASCLDTMLRRVYYHAVGPLSAGIPHRWSFLRPLVGMTTITGNNELALPDDLGDVFPPITFTSDYDYAPISLVDDGVIRIRSQTDQTNGWPRLASIVDDRHDGGMPSRRRFRFWPTPDAAYGIQFKAELKIDPLSSTKPHPPGGVKMAEVLLAAVRAAKELLLDDAPGTHTADFNRLLAEQVRADQQTASPQRLGVIKNPALYSAGPDQGPMELATVTFS